MVELVRSRLLYIVSGIFFNLVDLSSSEHNLMWLQPLRFLEHFPEEEQHGEDPNHKVGEQEVGYIPVAYVIMSIMIFGKKTDGVIAYLARRPYNLPRKS